MPLPEEDENTKANSGEEEEHCSYSNSGD